MKQLNNMFFECLTPTEPFSPGGAFAALLNSGQVVCWGDASTGAWAMKRCVFWFLPLVVLVVGFMVVSSFKVILW